MAIAPNMLGGNRPIQTAGQFGGQTRTLGPANPNLIGGVSPQQNINAFRGNTPPPQGQFNVTGVAPVPTIGRDFPQGEQPVFAGGTPNFNERTGQFNPSQIPVNASTDARRQAFLNQNTQQPQTMMQQQGQLAPQQAQQFQQAQPQFGLSGAEAALSQGFQGAGQSINLGAQNAVQTLGGNFSPLAQQISGDFSVQADKVDQTTGLPLFQEAAAGVNQFTGAGVSAQQRQAALSGALGAEAQQQAFTDFTESPGQAFLREQGLRQVTNAASATGGLIGGNVLSELQRQGQGLAQQDFQNQFNRLGSLSNQGLSAAGTAGGFLSQAGQQEGRLAGLNAQLGTQTNLATAANALSAATTNAQLGTQANIAGAGNQLSAAGQQAGFQNQQGVNIGNLFQGTAGNVAQNRFQAGRDIASQIGQTTSGLSNLANQQGSGLSDLIGAGAGNIANLLSGSGQFSAQQQQQLAQLLANISTGQGSQLAGINQQQGLNQANLALAQGQNAQNFVGNLAGAAGVFQGQQTPAIAPPPATQATPQQISSALTGINN